MKRAGKGKGISINGGTSRVNDWKINLAATPPIAPREFKPLKAKPHPRQAEMDANRAIPSRFA